MPCSDGDLAGDTIRELQNKVEMLTRNLCWMMNNSEIFPDSTKMVPNELLKWWSDHVRKGRERKARDAAVIKAAYDKLTPEERKALGL